MNGAHYPGRCYVLGENVMCLSNVTTLCADILAYRIFCKFGELRQNLFACLLLNFLSRTYSDKAGLSKTVLEL